MTQRIKKVREAAGLSQEALIHRLWLEDLDELHISQATLSRIEQGRAPYTIGLLAGIARACRCKVADLDPNAVIDLTKMRDLLRSCCSFTAA